MNNQNPSGDESNYTNNKTHERNQSGNMYSYRDSINEPPKESNAIRRSVGQGLNPNINPPFSQDISRKKPKPYT